MEFNSFPEGLATEEFAIGAQWLPHCQHAQITWGQAGLHTPLRAIPTSLGFKQPMHRGKA